MVLKQNSFRCR